MQQLSKRRLTNTPTDILRSYGFSRYRGVAHVCSNCGLSLNSFEGRNSVAGLKTFDNTSDAALTLKGENMQIYVLNHKGTPLMPCSPRKARLLLKQNKAKVVKRTPFTIQWTMPTRSYTQTVTLGVDSGYLNVGLSAVSDSKELYSSEVKLRTDIVKLNSERRQYRRSRRNRKTWYRKPRFLNRKKPEGWLAPSIQHKLDSHIKLLERVGKILPITKTVIEVAAFDIQKIKNPGISGTGYQNGDQKGFWNVREYVLYRDNHTCQNCKGKSKDPVLEVHHIISKQTGGDSPDNLITLCKTCHDKVSLGKIKLKAKPSKQFKAETFMTMVRWRLVNELRKDGHDISHTYGYITKGNRIELGLSKSHTNDAFVIAKGNGQKRTYDQYFIKQVRKCNRKLYRGDRSHIRNTAPREVFGFRRYDKVKWNDMECFIFGRRSTGYFDLRTLDGTKVHSSAKHNTLTLLERAGTLLTERRAVFLSPTSRGVSKPRLL
ncbi:MAG: HNH endonuclease [Bacteroidales bacterium]|nr:HNH endonuclease [Bacteroidales bacterium]